VNRTDKRQFIDEIHFLGKSKSNSSTFVTALKASFSPEDIEKALDDKRKKYNYTYANIFKKYNIVHDDLYEHLDKAWYACLNVKNDDERARTISLLANRADGAGTTAAFAVASISLLLPTSGGLFAIYCLAKMQYKIAKLWRNYKDACKVYAEEYVGSL